MVALDTLATMGLQGIQDQMEIKGLKEIQAYMVILGIQDHRAFPVIQETKEVKVLWVHLDHLEIHVVVLRDQRDQWDQKDHQVTQDHQEEMAFLVIRVALVCLGLVFLELVARLVSLGHLCQVLMDCLDQEGSRDQTACPVNQV